MRNKPILMIFAALALLAILAACTPSAPQPLAVISTITAQPPSEPNAAYPATTAYPVAEPTTASTKPPMAATEPPTAEPIVLPSPTPEPAEPWVSYIGADENLWIINPARGEMRQITQDAQPFEPGLVNIVYCCAVWSSDGQYLAYSRHVGTPIAEGGYNYTFHLWLFDITTGQSRELLADQQVSTFAWQPGTHNLTYGLSIENQYFTMHQVDPAYASGIWSLDIDSGSASELVKPVNGFTLVNPQWSPDGRFVGFEEVLYMEGRGNFAYYEAASGQYFPWNKAIGGYRWSPDGEALYYDYLTYMPSGSERVFRSNRQNTEEQQISTDYANAITHSPLLTPDGTQLIYTMEEMVTDGAGRYQIVIQPAASGEARVLGEFDQPGELSISADGSLLLLSSGQWDNRQISMITLADQTARVLVQGKQPVWQPVGMGQSVP